MKNEKRETKHQELAKISDYWKNKKLPESKKCTNCGLQWLGDGDRCLECK